MKISTKLIVTLLAVGAFAASDANGMHVHRFIAGAMKFGVQVAQRAKTAWTNHAGKIAVGAAAATGATGYLAGDGTFKRLRAQVATRYEMQKKAFAAAKVRAIDAAIGYLAKDSESYLLAKLIACQDEKAKSNSLRNCVMPFIERAPFETTKKMAEFVAGNSYALNKTSFRIIDRLSVCDVRPFINNSSAVVERFKQPVKKSELSHFENFYTRLAKADSRFANTFVYQFADNSAEMARLRVLDSALANTPRFRRNFRLGVTHRGSTSVPGAGIGSTFIPGAGEGFKMALTEPEDGK